MSGDEARLVAFVAVFAPEQAAALVARIAGAEAGGLLEEAARAARAPRRERLASLEAALGARRDEASRAGILEALLAGERPARAARLRSLDVGRPGEPGDGTALDRLLRERLEGDAG